MKSDHPYLSAKGAGGYAEARIGIDGRKIVEVLKLHLKTDSKLLEIGIGPGSDLLQLDEVFDVTGSDYSEFFLSMFSAQAPHIPLLKLDAETLDTDQSFDCVFSNKVLHHLSLNQLTNSIPRQVGILRKGGLLFHTFWQGSEKRFADDLHFNKYQKEEVLPLFESAGEVIDFGSYSEMNTDDSFYIAVKPGG